MTQRTDVRAVGRVHWRDTLTTWPSLTITVQLMPWHWRIRWHRDDIEPCVTLNLGPVVLDFSANRRPFALERAGVIRQEFRP